jgi:hypothetical protein
MILSLIIHPVGHQQKVLTDQDIIRHICLARLHRQRQSNPGQQKKLSMSAASQRKVSLLVSLPQST